MNTNELDGSDAMGTETTLSKTMAASTEKEQYDAACKRLLAEKIILAWIMKNTKLQILHL